MRRFLALFSLFSLVIASRAHDFGWTSTNALEMPYPGAHHLRLITPTLLELTLVTTRSGGKSVPENWEFVGENFKLKLPAAGEFQVISEGNAIAIGAIGFKRRPLYAPLRTNDLRIANWLYLKLTKPVRGTVEVRNPSGKLWGQGISFVATNDPLRFNPALHVNQVGYQPGFPKKAMVGYYLGSLGELELPNELSFDIIEEQTGKRVFTGPLKHRPDRGFTYSPAPYQKVFEADFSTFNNPGRYRLSVEGMGASYPFRIHPGHFAALARTAALGVYHQRCGAPNEHPFTRHTHGACHTAPAEVPTRTFAEVQRIIADVTADADQEPRHKGPPLKAIASSLYPFISEGKVDVSGGHHDAGDYSKYTINSAAFLHYLIFAVDHFKGAGELDNLALPESGDRISDLLQVARWEADFLAKMQDKDGGFYFLVYPKSRRYEDNVLPDKGDPQVVWPKTTAATAAAVAALAEAGSSPLMRKHYPREAEVYLTRALRGWAFLERALARHGKDGAYQKLTHYGHQFLHDDEIAWASAALFAATGQKEFEDKLKEWFDPNDPATRRWSWWPMFEGYGCAARTYVFGVRSGRIPAGAVDSSFLTRCETLIHTTAQNHVRFARETAYGTSFPDPNKANRNAGWYFSTERAFDIAVAYQLRPEPEYLEAILTNLNYELGCNPVNMTYITGLGWRRQREIVHQYAQNDDRVLPPSGLLIGNIQSGFAYLHHYKKELGEIPFPPDGANEAPFPFYDRWGDSFNTTTEPVIVDQARTLATFAFLTAQTDAKQSSSQPLVGQVLGLPTSVPAGSEIAVHLQVSGADPKEAQIVWELTGQEPVIAPVFRFTPQKLGPNQLEVEALWPDGRRAFVQTNFLAPAAINSPPNPFFSKPLEASEKVLVLYPLDGHLQEARQRTPDLKLSGNARFDSGNVSWMQERKGAALQFLDLGDSARVTFPSKSVASPNGLTLQAMIYINSFKAYNRTNVNLLSLREEWDASLQLIENMYEGPMLQGGTRFSVPKATVLEQLKTGRWYHLQISISPQGYEASIDGRLIAKKPAEEFKNWGKRPTVTLEVGNFEGWLDEVAILAKE